MDKISVEEQTTQSGTIYPKSFFWQGAIYSVESSGRRWEDEEGLHILVMTQEQQTFELLFKEAECAWYLIRQVSGPTQRSQVL